MHTKLFEFAFNFGKIFVSNFQYIKNSKRMIARGGRRLKRKEYLIVRYAFNI